MSKFLHPINMWFKHLNLKNQMRLLFICLSMIPLLILGYYSYSKTNDILKTVISDYAYNIIEKIDDRATQKFMMIDNISKSIANSEAVQKALNEDLKGFNNKSSEYDKSVTTILKSFLDSNKAINRIYVLPDNYEYIYYSIRPDISPIPPELYDGFKDNKNYLDVINGYNNTLWWTQEDISGPVFYLGRKLYDPLHGVQGVVFIEISYHILDGIMDKSDISNGSTLNFINENNMITFSSLPELTGKSIDDKYLKYFSQSPSGSFEVSNNSNRAICVYNTFFAANWKLMEIVPYKAITSEITSIRYFTIFLMAFFCLLTILAISIVSSGIYKPLQKLIVLMQEGTNGNLSVRFNALYDDDIGKLGKSFDELMDHIDRLIREIKYEQNQKSRAEIHALEAQMNPHFLYNTMASIYWTSMGERNYKSAQMIQALSNHIRLGLNKGREFTTVSNEAEHVSEYLKIQKFRFLDRLNYNIELDENVKELLCIKLILQPLVENSIVHGMQNNDVSCQINIKITGDSEKIEFVVEDNGEGIAGLDEKGLNSYIQSGFGLKNIDSRLRLYYQNDYKLEASSLPFIKTVFKITVPVKPWKEDEHL